MPRSPAAQIPVLGDSRVFPVRRIWCVGRNYAEHAREMGADPEREPPFFFAKPGDAIVSCGGEIPFPAMTKDLQHEVELAVAIGSSGRRLSPDEVPAILFGYAVALDMTRRDLQAEAKKLSRPWDLAKGFDQSCPIGRITPIAKVQDLDEAVLMLEVNGEIRQRAALGEMIWSIADCVAILSRYVALEPGDLLLTGTPAGVAGVHRGDSLRATCSGLEPLEVRYGMD